MFFPISGEDDGHADYRERKMNMELTIRRYRRLAEMKDHASRGTRVAGSTEPFEDPTAENEDLSAEEEQGIIDQIVMDAQRDIDRISPLISGNIDIDGLRDTLQDTV
jgi:hypothetical protein